jgi:hypothetical protein
MNTAALLCSPYRQFVSSRTRSVLSSASSEEARHAFQAGC